MGLGISGPVAMSESMQRRPRESRELKEILMDLGRRSLIDGVKEVLEDHGVDSSVKVEMVLRPTRAKGGRRATARKATKRRTR